LEETSSVANPIEAEFYEDSLIREILFP